MIITLSKKLKEQEECLLDQVTMDIEGYGINENIIIMTLSVVFGLEEDEQWELK